MEPMTISALAELCGGTLVGGDPGRTALGVSTDSRTIGEGHVFLALKGDKFDGHDFVESALQNGATGIVGLRDVLAALSKKVDKKTGLIGVDDTLAALQTLARQYRQRFDIPIVAVTGSCGKTTTKDMLAAILGCTHRVVATEGNLNNLIGAPLMLLRLEPDTEAAVFEIASNAPGEIAQLSRILDPTAGIITTIAAVHLEGLGNVEGVYREKSSLAANIRGGGFLVVNGDDTYTDRLRSDFDGKTISFGLNASSDFYATDIKHDLRTGTRFLLNDVEPIRLPLIGTHNVRNAVAAIAAAQQLGADIDSIRSGLDHLAPAAMRMDMSEYRGATIINDAYNANPCAMRESISTAVALRTERLILALGDMLELGEHATAEHRALGNYVGQERPDLLYVCGDFSANVREGAIETGMQPLRVNCCANAEEIALSLKYILRPGDLLLIKGSRGMKMERVVDLLRKEE